MLRLLFALPALALVSAFAQQRPINVVLIMADDVGYECFGAYGSKQYRTPRLDKMADSGVKFTRCYSTPLCTPSRVALMTGKSNVRNYTDFGALSPGEYTFADLFREAGYATAVAGKWQLQGSGRAQGMPAGSGFDTYCLWNTPLTGRNRFWNPSLERNGKLIETAADDYGPDIFTEFLLDFIEENRRRPFFAYYPMALVHSPFVPTPDSADRNSEDVQRNFEDMVAYTDKIVGRFEDKLEALGLLEKTLMIFTADNGAHHRLYSALDGRIIRGDKGAPTDAGTHVPLFVRMPGAVPGGREIDDLIDFADFLPTLADAAGLQLPNRQQLDGRSFQPQLLGAPGAPREWHYTYYFPRPFADAFDTPYANPEVRYARGKRYKLYAGGELFDLQADPREERPLAAGRADTRDIRVKLEAALESMPEHGARIPRERARKSQAAPRPRWE